MLYHLSAFISYYQCIIQEMFDCHSLTNCKFLCFPVWTVHMHLSLLFNYAIVVVCTNSTKHPIRAALHPIHEVKKGQSKVFKSSARFKAPVWSMILKCVLESCCRPWSFRIFVVPICVDPKGWHVDRIGLIVGVTSRTIVVHAKIARRLALTFAVRKI